MAMTSGREANTIHVTSTDGKNFSRKRPVMTNEDYPSDDTRHVRDPKVFRQDGRYLMVQGARRKDDQGEVLVFSSDNLKDWKLANRVSTDYPFGYMWECPDYFELPDTGERAISRRVKVLSVSPEGRTGIVATSIRVATSYCAATFWASRTCFPSRYGTPASTSMHRRPSRPTTVGAYS